VAAFLVGESLASIPGDKGTHRRLVQAGDLQVQVRKIAAALMDEQLRVQAVVRRAQLDQAQRPGDQTAGRPTRAARAGCRAACRTDLRRRPPATIQPIRERSWSSDRTVPACPSVAPFRKERTHPRTAAGGASPDGPPAVGVCLSFAMRGHVTIASTDELWRLGSGPRRAFVIGPGSLVGLTRVSGQRTIRVVGCGWPGKWRERAAGYL